MKIINDQIFMKTSVIVKQLVYDLKIKGPILWWLKLALLKWEETN